MISIGSIHRIQNTITDEIGLVVSQQNLKGYVQFLVASSIQPNAQYFAEVTATDLQEGMLDKTIYFTPSDSLNVRPNELSTPIALLSTEKLSEILRQMAFAVTRTFYEVVHEPRQKAKFEPGSSRVLYAGRVFDAEEMTNLVDSALDFWLTTGRYANEFETQFAKFLGVQKALLVNSGSSANLVAFSALTSPQLGERQIKKGDEVITVAAGFPTTVNPIIQYGAVPVFVDIDIQTHNIDVSQLEEALSSRTKAVMLAHTLGNPFDLKTVSEFCFKHKLWLVEDNCDALGSRYLLNGEWRYTGTIGDIGTSSFYPPHHMTMGEGGAVYSNSPKLKKIAESFRDWGRDCWCPSGKDDTCGKRFQWQLGELPKGYDHKYVYSHFGYNLKVTDMQAAIGVAQLGKLPQFIEARRKNWQYLRDGLQSLEEFFILPEATPNSIPSWFGFILTLRENAPFTRAQLIAYLESQNIQTRMLFAGNFVRHPAFDQIRNSSNYRIVRPLTNTDRAMHHSFWLGVYPGLTEENISFVTTKIMEFCTSSQPGGNRLTARGIT
jgi:CDP-6-deoxy-D-xylo-4-hexulose-3-dehydrase